MKINVHTNNTPELNGYINVNVDGLVNLDPVASPNSASEIILDRVLQTLRPALLSQTMNHVVSKLANDGVLKINVPSIRHIVRDFHCNYISTVDFHNLVFGGKDYSTKCLLDVTLVQELIVNAGLRIAHLSVVNNEIYIEATK